MINYAPQKARMANYVPWGSPNTDHAKLAQAAGGIIERTIKPTPCMACTDNDTPSAAFCML